MKVQQVSIERGGKFHARTMVPNNHKCAAMSTKVYEYFVRVHATSKRLTMEGFVVNNEHIQEYFDERFGRYAKPWDAVSCELLAMTAAKELCERLLQEADVRKVVVRIKGSNGAWIEAVCEPNQLN